MQLFSYSNRQIIFVARLFIPFALGFFISVLYRTVTAVLAPQLISEFGLSAADLGLIASSYFISFAAAQQPLGVALDRFGARRTLAVLMLFAVAGSMLFSHADHIWQLIAGRGLIGIGMSGCLMAAFKAYNEWLPQEKQPLINSFQALAGGIGGMAAAQPIYFILAFISWREVFLLFAVITIFTSLLIYKVVPSKPSPNRQTEQLSQQFMDILHIASMPRFWQLAPAATMVQSTFLALHTLWVGPWLKDVAGMTAKEAAEGLTLISAAVCAGYLLNGIVAHKLRIYGITTELVCLLGFIVFTLMLGSISILEHRAGIQFWLLLMLAGPFSILAYPIFIQMFESKRAGRVITLYNFMVFLSSFVIQWIMGILINWWPSDHAGYHPQGYKMAMLVLFFINIAAIVWMLCFKRGLEFSWGRSCLGKSGLFPKETR